MVVSNQELHAELERLQQHLKALTFTNDFLNDRLEVERRRAALAQSQLDSPTSVVVESQGEPATSGRRTRDEEDSYGSSNRYDSGGDDDDDDEYPRGLRPRYRSAAAPAEGTEDDLDDEALVGDEELAGVTYRSVRPLNETSEISETDMFDAMADGTASVDVSRLDAAKLRAIVDGFEALVMQGASCQPHAVEEQLTALDTLMCC